LALGLSGLGMIVSLPMHRAAAVSLPVYRHGRYCAL